MKRVISIMLIGVLLLLLCSCGTNHVWTPTGQAYLSGTADSSGHFFKDSVQYLPETIDTENVDFPEERTGIFRDQSMPLTLTGVTDSACGEYETENGNYFFRWDSEDHLCTLAIKDSAVLDELENQSKQEIIAWIQSLVNSYYSLDWSEYMMECRTNILGGEVFRQAYDDFVLPTEAGEHATYAFLFYKYIDQTKTRDSVRVFLSQMTVDGFNEELPSFNILIHFPDLAFDGMDSLIFDKTATDLEKDAFLEEHVNNYAYHEVTDSWAEMYNEKLYYVYTLDVFVAPDEVPDHEYSIGQQMLYIELAQS